MKRYLKSFQVIFKEFLKEKSQVKQLIFLYENSTKILWSIILIYVFPPCLIRLLLCIQSVCYDGGKNFLNSREKLISDRFTLYWHDVFVAVVVAAVLGEREGALLSRAPHLRGQGPEGEMKLRNSLKRSRIQRLSCVIIARDTFYH